MNYVLLDTDFISKGHISQIDSGYHLMDLVMDFPDCEFYCHEKTVEELKRHNIGDSPSWLADRISTGKIKCFTDKNIIQTMQTIYGAGAVSMYCQFLKKSCDAFAPKYYESHFGVLQEFETDVSLDEFLAQVELCEKEIGKGQSLGEKKSYILLQMLQMMHPGEVYVFCSDDRDARRNITSIADVKCISILSLFCELSYRGFSKQDVEPYFRSYEEFCLRHNQSDFKIWIEDKGWKRISVPSRQVLDDIFDGKIVELGTGELMYK